MKYLDTWSLYRTAGQPPVTKAPSLLERIAGMFTKKAAAPVAELVGGRDQTAMARGVDTSHWNGNVDIGRMHQEGQLSFVFAKASDGFPVRTGDISQFKYYVDDQWRNTVQSAYNSHVACGGYHFVQPVMAGYTVQGVVDRNWNAIQEAIRGLVPRVSYQMFALDVEVKPDTDYNGSDVVLKLLDRAANDPNLSKVKLVIYTSDSILNQWYTKLRDQTTQKNSSYCYWMAQWSITKAINTTWPKFVTEVLPTVDMRVITPGYLDWGKPGMFLQYTATPVLPGCSGNLDQNLFNGTEAQLGSFIGYDFGEVVQPPPVEPPTTGDYVTTAAFQAHLVDPAAHVHHHTTSNPQVQ